MCCSLIFDVPFMPAICGHSCVVTNCDDQRGFCSATFERSHLCGGTETMLVVMLARLQQFWKFWPALSKQTFFFFLVLIVVPLIVGQLIYFTL